MKVIKARKILKALRDDGWILKHQVGSHAQYVHPTKPGKVTIKIRAALLERNKMQNKRIYTYGTSNYEHRTYREWV